MDNVVLWLSAAINTAIAGAMMIRLRVRVTSHAIEERRAKNIYSALCFAGGLFSGLGFFLGLIALLSVPVGHGEILIAGPLLNLGLSAILAVLGRIVIGWEPMKW